MSGYYKSICDEQKHRMQETTRSQKQNYPEKQEIALKKNIPIATHDSRKQGHHALNRGSDSNVGVSIINPNSASSNNDLLTPSHI